MGLDEINKYVTLNEGDICTAENGVVEATHTSLEDRT